MINTTYN